MTISDWNDWHSGYDDPESELAQRMRLVQAKVSSVVSDQPAGPITVVSICGGQGREVFGALKGHPRSSDVQGRLVELDAGNVAIASEAAVATGVPGLTVLCADASLTSSYDGIDHADLVVLSGVFGHLSRVDIVRTINFVAALCGAGGRLVWTTYEGRPGRTGMIRDLLDGAGFGQLEFNLTPGNTFGVALERFVGPVQRRPLEAKIFEFGSSKAEREASASTDTI